VAALPGLHATAANRVIVRVRPCRSDLVRRPTPPGEVRWIRFLDLIHRLQPATLVNDRIGLPGDYQTPEQFIPSGIPAKGVRFNALDTSIQDRLKNTVPKPEDFQLWETCMTINNTWAYNSHDHEYKSSHLLIRSLVEVETAGPQRQRDRPTSPTKVPPPANKRSNRDVVRLATETSDVRSCCVTRSGRTRLLCWMPISNRTFPLR